MSTSPFRRILIPIDFTQDADVAVHSGFEVELEDGDTVGVAPASSKALELAAGIIDDGGQLCLVHATPTYDRARIYGNAGMGVVGASDINEVHEAARAASLKVLEALAKHYASGIDITFVVRPGIALQVILEEAERFDAQLVVIAASGRNRVARFFLGSTADRVIRQSPCPVMVVPPEQES
jgi:nucleotide-binding universal stress UspA family protein